MVQRAMAKKVLELKWYVRKVQLTKMRPRKKREKKTPTKQIEQRENKLQMIGPNINNSVISLTINGQNILPKKQRLSNCIFKKQDIVKSYWYKDRGRFKIKKT